MSILAALAKAYERLDGASPFGYSQEKIGFLISLNEDGSVANVTDLRAGEGKKKQPPLMQVPQALKRASGIAPNFLWDKTAYVLGVTDGEGKRTGDEHMAFVKRHLDDLAGTEDAGLLALCLFLTNWKSEQFIAPLWPDDMKDQNVVFALETERLKNIRIHDRPAAKNLWAKLSTEGEKSYAVCLVSGNYAPISRLHPSIKGVWGGQSSGGSIVAFNANAYESYGHVQGENAPVSEAVVFAYTTVLNKFLETGGKHRIQIGDASTVFWADAPDAETAELADAFFGACFEVNEETQSEKVGAMLTRIRNGEPMHDIAPGLEKDVRFCVLGLAPNAARLSIRYWFADDFKVLADNFRHYFLDMSIAPPPRDGYPALWKYLAETAVLGKRENVPPNLAGEWLRAILTGSRYPQTLLATVLMRIRADKGVNALRVQMLKAILIRNFNKEVPVALDLENRNKGYVLGRLFAVYEQVQAAALGSKLNATIKDKFYGSASAQPRKVFALLDKGSANHLSKVGKQSPGWKVNLERGIAAIMDMMQPSDDPFPSSLSAEEQALFAVGYYHQRSEFFKSKQERALDNNTESDGAKS
jgi:CRISPR-associated protein Csd1